MTGSMDCLPGGEAAVPALDSCCDLYSGDQVVAAEEEARLGLDAEYRRREVAARLERYRARRKPRPPRYPSLRLPFDSAETWSGTTGSAAAAAPSASVLAHQIDAQIEEPRAELSPYLVPLEPEVHNEPDYSAKVIEFPRSAAVPAAPASELAEPVWDRPRIVEAPEVLPPPPAMGGILIEEQTNREPQSAKLEIKLPTASLARRVFAGILDVAVLGIAVAAFGAIFVWVNPVPPPLAVVAGAMILIGSLLWAAYQFLFLVYTGSTPGTRLARISLSRFDGSPVSRPVRRWRVLASYLSALALGLGYFWSVLDEDGLCWHDRITRSHFS
jgi:uncharacterized RDD family membrane protein YckC